MDNIHDLFGAAEEQDGDGGTYNYYNYEINLLPLSEDSAPEVLREYGFLIENGTITAVLRGPKHSAEIMVSVPSHNVWYVKNLGPVTKTLNA